MTIIRIALRKDPFEDNVISSTKFTLINKAHRLNGFPPCFEESSAMLSPLSDNVSDSSLSSDDVYKSDSNSSSSLSVKGYIKRLYKAIINYHSMKSSILVAIWSMISVVSLFIKYSFSCASAVLLTGTLNFDEVFQTRCLFYGRKPKTLVTSELSSMKIRQLDTMLSAAPTRITIRFREDLRSHGTQLS